jgi:hypothetical protein
MEHAAPPSAPGAPSRSGTLTVAAVASIGAGAIHAVAAGAHSEHTQAMWVFVGLAALQIAWGVGALRRNDRPVAAAGLLLGVVAFSGWIVAQTVGIGFVEGLGGGGAIQTADVLAAGLALVTAAGGLLRLVGLVPVPRLAPVAAMAIVAATVPGMVVAGSHDHGDDHGDEIAHGDDHGDDIAHGDDADLVDHEGDDQGDHEPAVVPPTPYDPDKPLNLSGVEGVTEEQQAQAEQLIAVTLHHLPKWADTAQAEADGYHSIGDGGTGYEHYVNRELINDDKVLDPEYPESLVYQVVDGEKTLVAAMYMMTDDDTLDDVPDVGGKLTQWHIHNDLCFTPDPVAPKVAGLIQADGTCRDGLVKGTEAPMLHVWIVPHECGPFAALEGVAGGQIPEGEERWCDHAHGAS